MLYLLRSFMKDGRSILKIGYTRDENWEKRKSTYTGHNPGCEFLGTILKGKEEDERRLHHKFRSFKYEKLREWFRESEEIIDYFTSTSLEEIHKLYLPEGNKRKSDEIFLTNKQEISWLVGIMYESITSENRMIDLEDYKSTLEEVKEQRLTSIELTFEYLKSLPRFSTSLLSFDQITKKYEESRDILIILDGFSRFDEKMRSCCDLVQEGKKILLIPEPFRSYILTLGVNYIISVGGQKSRLDKAIQETNSKEKIYTKEEINERIYQEFKEGQRITKSDIKVMLSVLYEELGIPCKAKANDIENWFEVKRVLVNDSNGKRQAGFELIKRK